MEYIGRLVTKKLLNGGTFSGSVQAFESKTNLYVIVYENGDSVEVSLPELRTLLLLPPKQGHVQQNDADELQAFDLNKEASLDLNEIENSSAKRQKPCCDFDLNVEWIDDEESVSNSSRGVSTSSASSKDELPPSSSDLDLDGVSPFDFLSVYSFLRSFGRLLFLSPFRIEELVESVKCSDSTLLFDSVHVSLLKTLREHLETQRSVSASKCLRRLNWDLLDLITWPRFLFDYLLLHSPGYIPGLNIRESKLFQSSYYRLPVSTKVEILKHLCDEVVEVEGFRIEMDRRTNETVRELNLNYDSNSTVCSLCEMGGALICCEGCPAEFHTKCVGVVRSLLPEGEWYCPECVFEKENPWVKVGKAIRGAEFLGIDQYGRRFLSSCGYVLVSESHEDKCLYWSYNRNDIPNLLKTLESSPLYNALIKEIRSDSIVIDITPDVAQYTDIHYKSNYGNNYFNYYGFGREASFVLKELALISEKSTKVTVAAQTKAVSSKYPEFSWSNIQESNLISNRKEKCGWCCYCDINNTEKDCLFITNAGFPVLEKFRSKELGIELRKNRENHLIDVMCHMICIEDHLHGLLLGPWLNPSHSMIWRRNVAGINTVSSLKTLLLMLESNLHHRAFSADWRKHVDSAPTMGSASHILQNILKVSSTHGIDGVRARAYGMSFFWWRGGSGSRKIFKFKGLPRSLTLKAARQGGCKKIPGVLYPERGEKTKITRYDAWRAAVESSRTVDQFALQIRELDANIKWGEIGNTIQFSLMHKDLKNLFRKAIIRNKCSEGPMIKYLLDFGKQRYIPDVVLRHGVVLDDSSNKKKYWLQETHVPLRLLKTFEEKRIACTSDKTGSREHDEINGLIRKPIKKTGFDYLFAKAERLASYLCAHCEQAVIAREAVSCQFCEGYFHERHVQKSPVSPTAKCIVYICHKCQNSKLASDAVKEKEDFSELNSVPKGLKRKRSTTVKKKQSEQQLLNSRSDHRVSPFVPLRHSARYAECIIKQDESAKGILERINNRGWTKKKRSAANSSYWLKGLKLSKTRRTDDERSIQFRRKELLVLSGALTSNRNEPNCSLCDEMVYEPDLVYLACEDCGAWFHGDALDLRGEKIEILMGFKCHKCLNRRPPVCPRSKFKLLSEL